MHAICLAMKSLLANHKLQRYYNWLQKKQNMKIFLVYKSLISIKRQHSQNTVLIFLHLVNTSKSFAKSNYKSEFVIIIKQLLAFNNSVQ